MKKTSRSEAPVAPVAAVEVAVPIATSAPASRDQRRRDAEARDANARHKKPIEQRLRRIETKLAAAEAAKKKIEESLASPDAYDESQRERLKQQLIDQAYLLRDIEALEAEWLEQQALLERAA